MPQTIVEKIAQTHLAEGPDRPLRAGDFVSIRPFHVLTHDNTSAVMSKFKSIGAKKIFNPKQLVFALDHDIQNHEEANLKKYHSIEAFAAERGVDFYPAGAGIGHQLMIERGYVLPGSFVVASDSHSNMYGALGALGTPIVRTDAAAVWATGEFWWQIPRAIQVVLEGKLPEGVSGKDVIITLCGLYNHDETLNAAIEFSGPGLASLPMDARLSIANMSTEWGPIVAWFPVDEVTIRYLCRTRERLWDIGIERFTEADIERWSNNPPQPDSDATYAARIVLDLNQVTPQVSGPDTVQTMQSLAQIEKRRIAIQKAYLVSCVNSRLDDLEAAAWVLCGKKVAPGVKLYIGAASAWTQQEAEKRGAWQALLAAGAIPLPPSCGPCIGLGAGLLEKGEVGISATNRNFKGRMGSREAQCYLASPEVVAASAIAGYITGPRQFQDRLPARCYAEFATKKPVAERVEILPGFPERLEGRLVFVPQDNINTDAIYGKDYTYRDDMTPDMMARVVMENYDPQFSARTRAGDIVVGGFNFGTGSSREQAVTCLKAKGIPLIIAASFSQTYLRNAYNNGFLCIEVPELVKRLREQFAAEVTAKEKTILPGGQLAIDFTASTLTWQGQKFVFPPLGVVPQSLVVAGGAENVVAKKLGLGHTEQPQPAGVSGD
ncbi:MAG TPA: homoaconitase [Candidatus Sulfotelmatobacter sp.]|nr:homoaconitase [Candidatus Sulfotelmatobacter sp.]